MPSGQAAKTGDGSSSVPGSKAVVVEEAEEEGDGPAFRGGGCPRRARKLGFAPLPPYIKRRKDQAELRQQDLERYQTVFARKEGADRRAHGRTPFHEATSGDIKAKGVTSAGDARRRAGHLSARPAETVEDHRMLEECYDIAGRGRPGHKRREKQRRPVIAVGHDRRPDARKRLAGRAGRAGPARDVAVYLSRDSSSRSWTGC